MELQQASPLIKLEPSPAESFLSLPNEHYTSLFAPSTPSSTTINPLDVMTPQSLSEDSNTSQLLPVSEAAEGRTPVPEEPCSEKKPSKKRKSWGQVLPEPKTNLPPRKRAKTDDEKEQRRVERVLRNRRAAQSSRERKRLEVEALEHRNKELEVMLADAQKTNMLLLEELNKFRRDSGVVSRSSSPLSSLRDAPITLSQELFSSQDCRGESNVATNLVDQLIESANPTVNPASLSPELTPVPDEPQPGFSEVALTGEQNLAACSDLTQHPAEMLLDLQCHQSDHGAGSAAQIDAAFSIGDSFGLSAAIDTDRYVLESGLLASPDSSIAGDDYMVGDPAASLAGQSHLDLFNIDDFLNHEANNVVSDIMAASNYADAEHGFDRKPQSGASLDGCDDGGIAVGV
ncbi:hypothetical protein UVI_02015440 [Ustilaginoidea virens]|uniref:BZIP domain-containing protein n=1 Tax=Ustilaginoidea virens TaxID=1159556 RepID=A0A1B5KRX5_USTVR|nr:hypothetical protein UVI_02015440 [Ustilaginoidea virens]